jgi:tetratricopeptide (TPR) repeat protein
MPKNGGGGGWFSKHINGVAQSLGATAVALVAKPALEAVWQHFLHRPLPEWAMAIPYGVFVVALVGIWVLSKTIWWIKNRRARKTPRTKGDRISIYVARFGDDKLSADTRERVIASIRSELGPERVEVLPAGIQLSLIQSVSDDYSFKAARDKARSLLRKKHGDLLIWGKIYPGVDIQHSQLDLRFVSAEQEQYRAETFSFTEKLILEPNFGSEMGAALAAVASTQAVRAIKDIGKYLAVTLVPMANRLALLVHNMPASMRTNDRTELLHAFGLIQLVIGDYGDSSRLEDAAAAFREALQEWTRERVPMRWATVQNNLGAALAGLGERESGTKRLEQAVAAFREALKERTCERAPQDWAMTQTNLGGALEYLGERECGTERLEQAVVACRAALPQRNREQFPLDWAMTQNTLGNALSKLGERKDRTELLQEGVAALRAALQEYTRERVPLNWATTQTNLGAALIILGGQESGTERFKEAVAACRSALQECRRERVPLEWAGAQYNLGNALLRIDEREGGTERLEEAVAACRAALQEWTRERVPLRWAMAQNSLGKALVCLSKLEVGTEMLEEAVAAFRAALQERTREVVPLGWAATQYNLGSALTMLGMQESGTARLEEAVAAFRAAMQEWTHERVPQNWAMIQARLNFVTEHLKKRKSGLD